MLAGMNNTPHDRRPEGMHPVTFAAGQAARNGTSALEAFHEVCEQNGWSKTSLKKDPKHNAVLWKDD